MQFRRNFPLQIPQTAIYWNTRRMISAYTGTGAVYAVVANVLVNKIPDETKYSVYVPIATYGCNPTAEGDCELLGEL